jgi:hypothetical protein
MTVYDGICRDIRVSGFQMYSSKAERVTPATLTNVVTDLNFKKLIDIHLRLKKGGNPTLFPDYLIAFKSE